MSIDWLQRRVRVDAQIKKFGQLAKLRRASVDRDCWALEMQLSAHDRNALKNPTNRVFTISAVDLAVPPAKDDSLIWEEDGELKEFRQDAPVSPFQPGGVVIYWEIQVQGGRSV